MDAIISTLIEGFASMSGWEIVASLLGVGYILFASGESQWCWPLAFISTLIYTVLFWEGQLPMQAALNFYYMGMAVYGYLLWKRHGQQDDNLSISSWSIKAQSLFLILGLILTGITAQYLSYIDASNSPYLDAGVTIFSVMNTWLMAKKVIQNWLYWTIIDGCAITLYIQSGYYATALLFAIYTVLAVMGYISWKQLFAEPKLSPTHQ
jgi:nicotinamide mononucleotide transporter